MIAALVRFADEICEDYTRAAKHLIEEDKLPKQSQIFHHYAFAIKSVSVDKQDKSIQLDICIEKQYSCKKLGKLNEEVYLTNEIMSRLEKMNNERIYCSRFMCDIIQLQSIKATIKVVDENYETLNNDKFELMDEGYPTHSVSLAKEHPEWVGEFLEKSFNNFTENKE